MVEEKSIKWTDKTNRLIAAKTAFSSVIQIVVKKKKGIEKNLPKQMNASVTRTLSMHLRACVIINFFFNRVFFLIDRFSNIDVVLIFIVSTY